MKVPCFQRLGHKPGMGLRLLSWTGTTREVWMKWMKLGACAAALCLANASLLEARAVSSACASTAEISAVQVSAVVQELTDAALTCGPATMANMSRFQIVFQKELRRSDATLKTMFKRLNGNRAGEAAYDSYKTRPINHAEHRRIQPGAHANFCRTAGVVFAAALAPDKPVLEDFVSGVPVNEAIPVDCCVL